jgi:hypothetical protein
MAGQRGRRRTRRRARRSRGVAVGWLQTEGGPLRHEEDATDEKLCSVLESGAAVCEAPWRVVHPGCIGCSGEYGDGCRAAQRWGPQQRTGECPDPRARGGRA